MKFQAILGAISNNTNSQGTASLFSLKSDNLVSRKPKRHGLHGGIDVGVGLAQGACGPSELVYRGSSEVIREIVSLDQNARECKITSFLSI